MPKATSDIPEALRPFTFHGVDFCGKSGRQEAVADCPLCGKEAKFYVNSETGLWQCKSCTAGGDPLGFLRQLLEVSTTATRGWAQLANHRKLLHEETLHDWGAAQNIVTGEWMLPGYAYDSGADKWRVSQLYRYVKTRSATKGDQYRLLATPGFKHGIYGANLYGPRKPIVFLCEGPWDAMVLRETLQYAKWGDSGRTVHTNKPKQSLASCTSVLATPSCSVFNSEWARLFAGKRVMLVYDSDHPTRVGDNGTIVGPAGHTGMCKAAKALMLSDKPPKELYYLRWGEHGYDPRLPSGTDIRDILADSGNTAARRVTTGLNTLHDKLVPVPEQWLEEAKQEGVGGGKSIPCVPCDNWATLVAAWRRAMRWIEGLDRALSVMLASVLSTEVLGDPLWCKVLGPPASGKSTLCEAISINKTYIVAKSTIRGFHSGYKSDKTGDDDHSLVNKLYGKTLVTKDGDTLLQSPNLAQILSEARDIYDGTSRTHYRHQLSRDYEGLRMTWILCGTSSLRQIDSSELGERFIDCVIMDGIDEETEDEILWRVANRTDRNMSVETNGKAESHHDADLLKANQLTGGYIDHLRVNAAKMLGSVKFTPDMLGRCIRYGKFIAFMRTRPSKKQEESAERELASRLVGQMVRLAKCLAVVLNREEVDDEVMRRVDRVALDTARGKTMEVAEHLYTAGRQGLEAKMLSNFTGNTLEKEIWYLRFLKNIGVVEVFRTIIPGAINQAGRPKWRLTKQVEGLYREIVKND